MGKPQANDEATKEVLKEMEEAGTDVEGADDEESAEEQPEKKKPAADDSDDDEDDEDEDEEEADDADDSDDSEEDGDDADEEEDEEEDSEDDSEDDDEDDEDADEDDEPENKGKRVSLAKHQKVKKGLKLKIEELEKQLASKGSDSDDEDLKALAEESGIKVETLKKLAKTIQKHAVPAETLKEIEALKVAQLERHQGVAFKKELKALAAVHPDAKEHKTKLRELAFKEKNKARSLADIYFMDIKPSVKPGKRTAEASRGGGNRGAEGLDFEAIKADPKLMAKLSDEDFDKYVEWESKKKPSRVIKGKA